MGDAGRVPRLVMVARLDPAGVQLPRGCGTGTDEAQPVRADGSAGDRTERGGDDKARLNFWRRGAMTDKGKGWMAVLAAFGFFIVNMAGEIGRLGSWDKLSGTEFTASTLLHLGTAMGMFAAGKFWQRDN